MALNFRFKKEDDSVFKMAIFPTATRSMARLFVLNDDMTLSYFVGVRKNESINTASYLKKVESKSEKKLSEQEYSMLISIAEELDKSEYVIKKEEVVHDGWEVAFFYKGEVYEMNYGFNESEILRKLIDEVRELLPLVDNLPGWSL